MKLEDKKLLAEKLMGWTLLAQTYAVGIYFPKDKFKFWINDWNPDTNPEQFKEVWNKLTLQQQMDIAKDLSENRKEYDNIINAFNHILDDLPKVMDAVLEVIKENAIK